MLITQPVPLSDPPFPLATPSVLERICIFVPFLGWCIAAFLDLRRHKPWARHIEQQIRNRTEPTIECWGDDPGRISVAAVVCEELQREFDWPNDHFLPDDPLRLLIWQSSFDQELLFVLVEVEKRLGKKKTRHLDYAKTTLGALVDAIAAARDE